MGLRFRDWGWDGLGFRDSGGLVLNVRGLESSIWIPSCPAFLRLSSLAQEKVDHWTAIKLSYTSRSGPGN